MPNPVVLALIIGIPAGVLYAGTIVDRAAKRGDIGMQMAGCAYLAIFFPFGFALGAATGCVVAYHSVPQAQGNLGVLCLIVGAIMALSCYRFESPEDLPRWAFVWSLALILYGIYGVWIGRAYLGW